ncbi:MAG: hypothetical protein K2J26_02055, partial [Ruminococcus sp.]|nr:hypothetical protein [Ruminococcus sp.]
ADLVLMHRYLLGAEPLINHKNGDMNNDSSVDTFDIVLMRRELKNAP